MHNTLGLRAAARIVALALVLAALTIGPTFANDAVGTWKGTHGTTEVTLVLKADGTGQYHAAGHDPLNFKWHEGDEGLVFENPTGGKPDIATLQGDGTLHVVDGDNGKTTVFTRE